MADCSSRLSAVLSRESETEALAAGLARLLEPGDVVFISGPLGAGKTVFIRSAARALGMRGLVTSPSFTIAQTYAGRRTIHHLDLYRLISFRDSDALDLEPYFGDDAITFVEWPERADDFLPKPALVVKLEHVDENSRRLSFSQIREGLEKGVEELVAGARH